MNKVVQCSVLIFHKTLLNIVSKNLLPFMVRQSHDSFTLPSVKGVMFFPALSAGHARASHEVQTRSTLKQPECQVEAA
jgi:hypothetical protein